MTYHLIPFRDTSSYSILDNKKPEQLFRVAPAFRFRSRYLEDQTLLLDRYPHCVNASILKGSFHQPCARLKPALCT